MKNIKIKSLQVIIPILITFSLLSCLKRPGIEALIITGQNNHKWQGSNVAIRSILENTGIFKVDVAISPSEGRDMSEFIIDFSPYDLVILDYSGDEWPDQTKKNFVSFVDNGGGIVVYHAASSAFPGWKEYNEITGLGGWGKRDESSGPYVYIKDGEVVRDDSPGRGGSHGPQHEFVVETINPDHPIMKGLPDKWLHIEDELYSELRGPGKSMEILATAYSDEKYKGTGRNEPIIFTVRCGKGRIFHTVLGHAGAREMFYPAMECAGFIITLQRGAEWAATGKVTQKLPENLPSETETVRWKYYEKMDMDIIRERISDYEIGKTNNCFIALKDMIKENIDDPAKIEEYHNLLLDILQSHKASKEGKKILMKDFSWMANESYIPVYKDLSTDEDLKNEAIYALEILD